MTHFTGFEAAKDQLSNYWYNVIKSHQDFGTNALNARKKRKYSQRDSNW